MDGSGSGLAGDVGDEVGLAGVDGSGVGLVVDDGLVGDVGVLEDVAAGCGGDSFADDGLEVLDADGDVGFGVDDGDDLADRGETVLDEVVGAGDGPDGLLVASFTGTGVLRDRK